MKTQIDFSADGIPFQYPASYEFLNDKSPYKVE